jgi:hypothetical protein
MLTINGWYDWNRKKLTDNACSWSLELGLELWNYERNTEEIDSIASPSQPSRCRRRNEVERIGQKNKESAQGLNVPSKEKSPLNPCDCSNGLHKSPVILVSLPSRDETAQEVGGHGRVLGGSDQGHWRYLRVIQKGSLKADSGSSQLM